MVDYFKKTRNKIAQIIAPEIFKTASEQLRVTAKAHREIEETINQRVAAALLTLDPVEIVMKKYHGVFSEQFERPEARLNAQGQLGMMMWGWQQSKDPYFKHMTDWILNTQGNNTIRKAKQDREWDFGRACIVNIESFVKEIGRLASLYEDMLERQRGDPDFKSELPIE